ncbi:MAG: sigma-70 family RNA polymerase sigma factor [Planctomycetes bacterium]|nr:sigma-70 family RNA polymerase sigma factor [Planctomycetota bacterium]
MPESWDETTVILGLRDGQREAWQALYEQYSVRVWRYVLRVVGPDAASPGDMGSRETSVVADLVQETFLAAARSARQFDAQRGTLWCWLTGIAHHHALQHWRRERRAARESPARIDHNSTDGSPLEQLQRREVAERVRTVLSELTDDYAALLMAKYFDDLSLEEMTRNVGGTLEGVRSKLARARREFRERFERVSSTQRLPTCVTAAAPKE